MEMDRSPDFVKRVKALFEYIDASLDERNEVGSLSVAMHTFVTICMTTPAARTATSRRKNLCYFSERPPRLPMPRRMLPIGSKKSTVSATTLVSSPWYSLTHSLTHSRTHSLTHSLTRRYSRHGSPVTPPSFPLQDEMMKYFNSLSTDDAVEALENLEAYEDYNRVAAPAREYPSK